MIATQTSDRDRIVVLSGGAGVRGLPTQLEAIGYEVVTSPRAAERSEVAAFIDWIVEAAAAERDG